MIAADAHYKEHVGPYMRGKRLSLDEAGPGAEVSLENADGEMRS